MEQEKEQNEKLIGQKREKSQKQVALLKRLLEGEWMKKNFQCRSIAEVLGSSVLMSHDDLSTEE